jgi:hypothetical protein
LLDIHTEGTYRKLNNKDFPLATYNNVTCKIPSVPAPKTGKDEAVNAILRLSQSITAMESSQNPVCQTMAEKFWGHVEKADRLVQQGQMLESRFGNNSGNYNYNLAINMAKQTETFINQYECNR